MGIFKGEGKERKSEWGRGRERLLGERSFHQPTINKIVFYDAWGDEKQFEILFFFLFFLHCACNLRNLVGEE
ncbi:hypothetical protein AAZX31_17G108400 [Glycine max]